MNITELFKQQIEGGATDQMSARAEILKQFGLEE